jgi:hypothetical protein
MATQPGLSSKVTLWSIFAAEITFCVEKRWELYVFVIILPKPWNFSQSFLLLAKNEKRSGVFERFHQFVHNFTGIAAFVSGRHVRLEMPA